MTKEKSRIMEGKEKEKRRPICIGKSKEKSKIIGKRRVF